MELQQFERMVMTNGGETSAFTATLNGAAFAIMSDAIYEYKIAAIVRELSCNANDSHIEAGKEDTPFKIQIPSKLDPNFSIEDFGVGLDDEGVRTVFASYFNSTKNKTNDVTGGFGIGAKSIFSYSDSFTIRARKDGVERQYAAFIGEEGIPQVQILSEMKTDMGNGVRVSVPVQENDFYRFRCEIEVISSFFRTSPELLGVLGGTAPFDTTIYDQIEEKGYAIIDKSTRSNLYSYTPVYALMGSVLYPIPEETYNDPAYILSYLRGTNDKAIIIPFEIGELAPVASREGLSLTPKTKEMLKTRVEGLIASKVKDIQTEVSSCSHMVEAIQKFHKHMDNRNALKLFDYKTDSLSMIAHRKMNIPHASYAMIAYTSGGRVKREAKRWIDPLDLATSPAVLIFYRHENDERKSLNTNVGKYLRGNDTERRSIIITIDRPTSKHRIDRIKKLLGVEPAVILDSITLREENKKVRENYGRTYDNGEKTKTSIYCKMVQPNGQILPIAHQEIDPDVTYITCENDAWTEDIRPSSLFGASVWVILTNSVNEKRISSFGFKKYQEAMQEAAEQSYGSILSKVIRGRSYMIRTFSPLETYGNNDRIQTLAPYKEWKEYIESLNLTDAENRNALILLQYLPKEKKDEIEEIARKAIRLEDTVLTIRRAVDSVSDFRRDSLVKMIQFGYDNGLTL